MTLVLQATAINMIKFVLKSGAALGLESRRRVGHISRSAARIALGSTYLARLHYRFVVRP